MDTAELAHLRKARNLLDPGYARPLDVPGMARVALLSPPRFSRRFRDVFSEVPYGYLQEPIDQPFGIRDCGVRDPNGNHVRLSQQVERE